MTLDWLHSRMRGSNKRNKLLDERLRSGGRGEGTQTGNELTMLIFGITLIRSTRTLAVFCIAVPITRPIRFCRVMEEEAAGEARSLRKQQGRRRGGRPPFLGSNPSREATACPRNPFTRRQNRKQTGNCLECLATVFLERLGGPQPVSVTQSHKWCQSAICERCSLRGLPFPRTPRSGPNLDSTNNTHLAQDSERLAFALSLEYRGTEEEEEEEGIHKIRRRYFRKWSLAP